MTTLDPKRTVPSIDTLFDSVVPSDPKPSVYNDLKQCLKTNEDLFALTPKQLDITILVTAVKCKTKKSQTSPKPPNPTDPVTWGPEEILA
jgi:hypothetical protein